MLEESAFGKMPKEKADSSGKPRPRNDKFQRFVVGLLLQNPSSLLGLHKLIINT
jgi:hypothetical protein